MSPTKTKTIIPRYNPLSWWFNNSEKILPLSESPSQWKDCRTLCNNLAHHFGSTYNHGIDDWENGRNGSSRPFFNALYSIASGEQLLLLLRIINCIRFHLRRPLKIEENASLDATKFFLSFLCTLPAKIWTFQKSKCKCSTCIVGTWFSCGHGLRWSHVNLSFV